MMNESMMSSSKPSLKRYQQEKILYNSKNVGQSLDNSLTVNAGEKASKIWIFRNEGTLEWPQSTRL